MNGQAQSPHQALWAVLIDDLIDQRMATEVDTARKLMESYLKGKPDMQRKQLSNLEAVAAETNSVPVVEDWVRYQIGRDSSKPPKNWRAGSPEFGGEVLKQLDRLKGVAKNIVDDAKKKGLTPPPSEANEMEKVWILLTRRFASLLEHSFVYYDSMTKGGRPS